MANWDLCRTGLYWSANHNQETWKKHGDALQEYVEDDEDDGFEELKDIHDHDGGEETQQAYEECRASNRTQFWQIAQSVYRVEGPRGDV